MPPDIDTCSREPRDHRKDTKSFEAQPVQRQRFHGDGDERITATSDDETRPKEPKWSDSLIRRGSSWGQAARSLCARSWAARRSRRPLRSVRVNRQLKGLATAL